MSLQIQPFTVAAYGIADNGGTRQLFVVDSEVLQRELIDEAIRTGGQRNGNWFAMADKHGVHNLEQVTKDMGGFAYDLPFR